jgi:hypothetical protein
VTANPRNTAAACAVQSGPPRVLRAAPRQQIHSEPQGASAICCGANAFLFFYFFENFLLRESQVMPPISTLDLGSQILNGNRPFAGPPGLASDVKHDLRRAAD